MRNLFEKRKFLPRKKIEKHCDLCGEFFITTRNHQKRCSRVCSKIKKKNDTIERYRNGKYLRQRYWVSKICAVCNTEFKGHERRVTCSKECANTYCTYSWKKDHNNSGFEIMGDSVRIPLPEHPPIKVGKINIKKREDLKLAMDTFLKKGGQIRKLKAGVEFDLNNPHPLDLNSEIDNSEDIKNELNLVRWDIKLF